MVSRVPKSGGLNCSLENKRVYASQCAQLLSGGRENIWSIIKWESEPRKISCHFSLSQGWMTFKRAGDAFTWMLTSRCCRYTTASLTLTICLIGKIHTWYREHEWWERKSGRRLVGKPPLPSASEQFTLVVTPKEFKNEKVFHFIPSPSVTSPHLQYALWSFCLDSLLPSPLCLFNSCTFFSPQRKYYFLLQQSQIPRLALVLLCLSTTW